MSKKISQLSPASLPLAGNEIIPITQNGETVYTPCSAVGGIVNFATDTEFQALTSTNTVVSPAVIGNYSSENGSFDDGGKFVRYSFGGSLNANEVRVGSFLALSSVGSESMAYLAHNGGFDGFSFTSYLPHTTGKYLASTPDPYGSVYGFGSEENGVDHYWIGSITGSPTTVSTYGWCEIHIDGTEYHWFKIYDRPPAAENLVKHKTIKTDYVLLTSDHDTCLRMESVSSIRLSIPLQTNANWLSGMNVTVTHRGNLSAVLSLSAAPGITLNASMSSFYKNQSFQLVRVRANEWDLY